MRPGRIILLVVLVLAVSAGVLAVISVARSPSRECKLADGSVLRLEKVSYGRRVPFKPSASLLNRAREKLIPLLPKQWTGGLVKPVSGSGNWYMNGLVHTNNDALQIWVTRRSPGSGSFQNVDFLSGEILDEHGCLYRPTQSGGENLGLPGTPTFGGVWIGPQSTVTWLTFEGFPRHEKQFRLRLYDWKMKLMGELIVANPAWPPKPAANWAVEPFPIVRNAGDVAFVLKSATLKTNSSGVPADVWRNRNLVELAPEFEVLENGAATQAWEPVEMELWDASGNFATRDFADPKSVFLCPGEPAWKLIVKFYGSDQAAGASNAVWTLKGAELPAPGKVTALDQERILQGVKAKAIALGGIGEVIYQGDQVAGCSLVDEEKLVNSLNVSRSGQVDTYVVRSTTPHIAIAVGRMAEDQRLTVWARDDQGRVTFAGEWSHTYPPAYGRRANRLAYLKPNFAERTSFLTLDLPPGARTVEVTICIHRPETVEFIFKPPAR